MLGERRDPIVETLLSIVTCTLWVHVWMYQISRELRQYAGRADIDPAIDVLAGIFTCGLYYVWSIHRNAQVLLDATRRAGLVPEERTAAYMLMMVFFPPAAVYFFQEELNRLWAALAARGPTT